MAIYGRFGDVVTVVRVGTVDDVRDLERREPDERDRQAVECASYLVVRLDDGEERLYHRAYLRADDGALEIDRALDAVRGAS